MYTVIVESPAKSKTINKYLGNDYIVLASFGHVRDLPSKNGSVRPDEDFAMDYQISTDSVKHVKAIVDAVKKSDALYLATDPDREGEAISWHVVELLRQKRVIKADFPIYRVAFNAITKKAVLEAMESPRALDMDLVNAQQARRALDYLVGFTLSPVLWRKLPGSKSAGRVQSVSLRLICSREDEIERFVSREYWDIKAQMSNGEQKLFMSKLIAYDGKKLEQFDLVAENQATDIVKALELKDYSIKSVEKKKINRKPFAPFTTSTLQQEAARKLGFGAKRTMTVAQKLYEGFEIDGETVGLITYMRTDGVTVAQEAIDETRQVIENEFGGTYVPKEARKYSAKAKNAQEAHEAIRPTSISRLPKHVRSILDNDFLRLYELIWKRMVASQMENALLNQVSVTISSSDQKADFRATGSSIEFDGFLTLYIEGKDDASDDDDDKMLPVLKEGEPIDVKELLPAQHFTQPPPRYSEASLVKKMEELGIGRPSTYASIVSVLQEREYVRLEKKRFFPEERGRIVTAFLESFFARYVEYDFTANLENQLDYVSAGKIDWKQVLQDFWKDFIANVDEVKQHGITEILESLDTLLEYHLFPHDEDGNPKRECSSCDDGKLSLKLGKFGAFIGCSNYPECKYTQQIDGAINGTGDDGGQPGAGAQQFEPKILGKDESAGKDVYMKKGPYGFYLQSGSDDEVEKGKKPKRISLPKGHDPMTLDLATALGLLSLPRIVGDHPETGTPIKANIGRYGPYLEHDKKFVSLKDDDVLVIGINRAVVVLGEAKTKGGAEPVRVLGVHPEDKIEVAVYEGRYGPYIKYQKTNVPIPKTESIDTITLQSALELIQQKLAKGGGEKSTRRKKKE